MIKKRVFLQNGTNTTLRPRSKRLYNGCMMRWTESGRKGDFLLWGRFGRNLRVLVVMVPGSSLSEMMPMATIGRGVALGAILTPRRGKRKMRLDTYRNNYGDSLPSPRHPSQVNEETGGRAL